MVAFRKPAIPAHAAPHSVATPQAAVPHERQQAGVELDARGNVKAPLTNYQTSKAKIFSCGDMRRGQSLVVWAIREGRQAARAVDEFLTGSSDLPR